MNELTTTDREGGARRKASAPSALRKVTRADRERHYRAMMKLLPNTVGKRIDIDKSKLSIGDYQRQINARQVKRIKENFHWALFGVLFVAKRTDGSLYVFDGQHRLQGAMQIEDIKTVPCLLWAVQSEAAEAAAFNLLAQERTRGRSFDRFNTELISGDPLAVALNGLLERYHIKVSDAPAKMCVSAIDQLKTMYQSDPVALDMALNLYVNSILPKTNLKGQIIAALFYLTRLNGEKMLHTKIKRKLSHVGEEGWVTAIRQSRSAVGHGAPWVYAKGLHIELNKVVRGDNKLKLFDDKET